MVVLAVGSAGWLLGDAHYSASGAPADPRAAQVRRLLEQGGYRVREVTYRPAYGETPAFWEARFDARYFQPTYKEMEAHFIAGWRAITAVAAARDPVHSRLGVTQVWKTYGIRLVANLGPATMLVRDLQAARTGAQRGEALAFFMRSLFGDDLEVRDEARSVSVPALDFVAANVRDNSVLAVQTIPHFVAARIKATLVRQGLKDVDVTFLFPSDESVWTAASAAAYAQPSYDAVYGQARRTWSVLHNALSGYAADTTYLRAIQIWHGYRLEVTTTRAAYAALLKGLEAAATAAARAKAYQAFLKQVRLDIWDTRAKKSVPTDEFMRQYSAR